MIFFVETKNILEQVNTLLVLEPYYLPLSLSVIHTHRHSHTHTYCPLNSECSY